jgi:hypothetical protein
MFCIRQDSGQTKYGRMYKLLTKQKKGYNPVPIFAKKNFSVFGTEMKLIKLNKMGLHVHCVLCVEDHLCNNPAVQSGIKDVLALLLLISIQNTTSGRKQEQFKIPLY